MLDCVSLGLGLGSWIDHNIGMITTAGVQGAAPLGKVKLKVSAEPLARFNCDSSWAAIVGVGSQQIDPTRSAG